MKIERLNDFNIEAFLDKVKYKLPKELLEKSDLLLLPYIEAEDENYPAFMRGSYELIKDFKLNHNDLEIQPIYEENITPGQMVFNDISLYLGSFIVTSLVAPLFVNWLYDKWKKNFKNDNDVKINININIYDKGDKFATVFSHSDSVKEFNETLIPKIKEYSDLKNNNNISQFDDKYIGSKVDKKM